MDGLMIETEHLQSKSFEHVLRSHGIEPEYNSDGVIQKVGVTAGDNIIHFKEKHKIDEDVESMLDKKQKYYKQLLLQNIAPKEGLLSLINILKKNQFKLAVASSSNLENIEIVL